MNRLIFFTLAPLSLLAAPNAYIGHTVGNQIDSVDTATNTLNPPIAVGNNPQFLAVTPDASTVYVSNAGDGTVSIVDATLMAPMSIATVPVGTGPQYITVSPDDTAVFVCNSGGTSVSWFDRSIPPVMSGTIPTSGSPNYITFSPDGLTGYIVDRTGAEIVPFSTVTKVSGAPILLPGGSMPISMVVTPDGSKGYVPESAINQVAMIDFTMGNMVTQISVNIGSNPQIATITPDGSKVVVGNGTSMSISVIDTGTDMATETIVGGIPFYIAINDNTTAFISNVSGSNITAFDLATTATTSIPTGMAPSYMAFTPDGTKLFVSTIASLSTTVVDLTAGYPTTTIPGVLPGSLWIEILPSSATPLSPVNLKGTKTQNIFLLQTDLINLLTWSPSARAVSYRIYSNASLTNLLATVPSTSPLRYEAHNIGKHETRTYYVVAVSATGNRSAPSIVTIAR